MNTKLHALCNGEDKPLAFVLTEGQVSDYNGVKLLLNSLPQARELLPERGYDADWFRDELTRRGITSCIPPAKSRKQPALYDKNLYKQRYKIEIMFGRLKDSRRTAMRYDHCAHMFYAALCFAFSVLFLS